MLFFERLPCCATGCIPLTDQSMRRVKTTKVKKKFVRKGTKVAAFSLAKNPSFVFCRVNLIFMSQFFLNSVD